jgi:transcriptional regulator with AAA-type ATPase domain
MSFFDYSLSGIDMRTLVSWIGVKKDFTNGHVSDRSPNYLLHKQKQYDYDRHIVLYNKEDHRLQARLFQQAIESEFVTHRVELRPIRLIDERDLNEVQDKVGSFIKDLENDDVTILLSTGTSILKIAWYVFASSFQQPIRLIQYRANHDDFGTVKVDKSSQPYSLMVIEHSINYRSTPSHLKDMLVSASVSQVYDRASKIALVDNTVLIIGETGTGKEHLAKHIHFSSSRRNGPFLSINCASFSDELLSSELFGYVKGAYTGATTERKGIFEQARGGTVFLDEIGDISAFMQQSLLRVLQEKKIQRVGGAGKDIDVDVRLVAATNRDLLGDVSKSLFRADLYYRLSVNELELPPLREWSDEDKMALIDFLIDRKAKELKLKPITFTEEALEHLVRYGFPGNIRELENLIAGLYPFRTDEPIAIMDLPRRIRVSGPVSFHWEIIEAEHIKKVLRHVKGNQSEACRQIGYSVNTLKKRLRAYNIDVDDFKP